MSDAQINRVLNPAVIFRRRSGWEAADMGVFLLRKNLVPVLFFTGIPAIILFSFFRLAVILEEELMIIIIFFIVWWMKPLIDRFCLHVISIRFFEPMAPFRRLFKGLGKTIKTGLPGDLLWRRFSPARSAHMPILVLERQKRENYKRRKQLLARNGLGFGMPLTLICIGMETALNAGVLVFIYSVFIQFTGSSINIFDFIEEKNAVVLTLYFFNLVLMEMLYVSMGFSIYINSRVETEGWDIELLFKKCVARFSGAGNTGGSGNNSVAGNVRLKNPVVPAVVLSFMLFFTAGRLPVYCNHSPAPESLKLSPVSEKAAETLEQIFESPDFGSEKPSQSIRLKRNDKNQPVRNTVSAPSGINEITAILLRFFLVLGLAAALGFAVFHGYRRLKHLFPRFTGLSKGKSSITDEFEPDDSLELLQRAEEFHRKGRIREAWALCFRAFVSVFVKLIYFTFPGEVRRLTQAGQLSQSSRLTQATEYEMLALVRKNNPADENSGFEFFIKRWINFAYGGKEPEPGSFEEALASCRSLLENKAAGYE